MARRAGPTPSSFFGSTEETSDLSAAAQKKTAPVASEGGELGDEHLRPKFSIPSAIQLQDRYLEALEICADWKESIERRRSRLLLRAELIGGVDEEEVEEVRQDAERLRRCMEVLAWRPAHD
jgi:hypothetical protein